MHKKIYGKEIKNDLLKQIINDNREKFRSLTAEKTYTYDEYKKIKDNKDAEIQQLTGEIQQLQNEKNEMMNFLLQTGLMEMYEKSKKNQKG